LLELLICPDCQSKLQSFDRCDDCGIAFQAMDGTPALFAQRAKRTVSFQFTPSRSVMSDEFRKCFTFPSGHRGGDTNPDAPHHLDKAHRAIIDRLPANSAILEIGCGGGQMRAFVRQRGHRYIGTDISKSRVHEHLRMHGGPDLLCDSHFLPFQAGSFDAVYSAAVTEHLACPFLVAQEVARVLKPGGYYLGNVSFLEPWHDDSYFHMSPLGAYENLKQAGFELLHIWPGHGYSGYRSIMAMGNKATGRITFVGDLIYLIYRSGNRLRNLAKRRKDWWIDRIEDAAKVAGATDWIARKPM
jgi:SAM-dependent methyltransferase